MSTPTDQDQQRIATLTGAIMDNAKELRTDHHNLNKSDVAELIHLIATDASRLLIMLNRGLITTKSYKRDVPC